MKLIQLIEYDEWANKAMYALLKEHTPAEGEQPDFIIRMNSMFRHLLEAQLIWHGRITGVAFKSPAAVKKGYLQKMIQENPPKLKALIPWGARLINYQNSKGESFQNSVDEILTHLIIHGQHHRAQIALLFRQNGIAPPPTDLIFYIR